MKREERDQRINMMAVALFAFLAVTIGAMFLTRSHSTSAFALGGQLAQAEFEFNNTLNPNNGTNLSWDDFTYLSTLERAYRSENPEATPDETAIYLDSEITSLMYHKQDLFSTMNSDSGSGPWTIFGFTLTTQEISLFATYPAQAIQAYNASEDAKSKGDELYFNYNNDDHNPNAFRHGYWNALMEKRISKDYLINVGSPQIPWYTTIQLDFAKMFADAHEYGISGISTDMDYRNNALGRIHGATYGSLSEHNMALEMTKRIANGEFHRIVDNNIVATNWEDLRPQFLYSTTPALSGVSINGIIYKISGSLDIPSTINGQAVVAIGNSAFANQTLLTQVLIPAGILDIGGGAFRSCEKLTSVTFGSGSQLESIGDYAFRYCPLTSITIPSKVSNIGLLAFDGCSELESIAVENGNSTYRSAGNCLIKISSDILELGCKNSIIPDGIKKIGVGAFAGCAGLTRIVIPDGVTNIGAWAFANCSNLKSIVIPQSMQVIERQAFGACYNLRNIAIPSGVANIGQGAFELCISLTIAADISGPHTGWHSDWNISDRPVVWNTINGVHYVLEGSNVTLVQCYNSAETFTIPKTVMLNGVSRTVTKIGSEAFVYRDWLSTVNIPNSVKIVEVGAFAYCSGLRNIVFEANSQLTSIEFAAFYECASLSNIIIPDSVTIIEEAAFYGCSGLTSVTLSNNMTYIDTGVFAGCSALTSISIPGNITSIGDFAFSDCANLKTIYIERSAMSGITTLGSNVFSGCTSLSSIYVPGSVSAAAYKSAANWSTYQSKVVPISYNIIYNNLSGATNSNPATYTIETATITLSAPGSRAGYTFAGWYDNAQFTGTAVTEIPQGSSGNKGLFAKWVVNTLNITYSGGGGTGSAPSSPSSSQYGNSITMPANTYSRTGYTFAGWSVTGAGSISGTYQAGANVSVTALSSGINSGNASITLTAVWTQVTYTLTYTLNGGSFSTTPPATFTVEDLPFALPAPERNGYTFAGWYDNENFTGTAVTQVTTIGNKAFYAKWTQVTPGLAYTYISSSDSYEVSKGTANAAHVIIPAFYNGKPVTRIADYGFSYYYALESITIPDSVTEIGQYAFYGSTYLTSVMIGPDSELAYIGNDAFNMCQSLLYITIPGGVVSIGDSAFFDCYMLTITITGNIEYIGQNAFYWCYYVTIYTGKESQPEDWPWDWMQYYSTVVWGCTLSEDETYVVSITTNNIEGANNLNDPYRYGYTFGGWSLTEGGTTADYDINSIGGAPSSAVLYAIWIAD